MNSRPGVVLVFLALSAALPGAVLASGYSIYEQGAKATANAGAFTARADDPSAMFYNPAGIASLKGKWFSVGTNAIFLTNSSFDSDLSGNSFDQADNMAWPSNIYYTQTMGSRYAWGVAITSPFGLKTEWTNDFDGRFISRESNLAVLNFNANFAWTFAKNWSAAIGADFAWADVRELSQNLDFSPLFSDGFAKLTGDGRDVGGNAAMRWASDKGWRWGASYRSRMKPKIEGDIRFENIPAPLAPLFPDGDAMAHIVLPATFATGVGYVKGKWEGEIDVVWTDWSEFDHLQIEFTGVPGSSGINQVEDWHDTWSYRVGYAYHINDRHQYRLGAYFDRNPIPTTHVRPRLPDADRTSVQAGYGYSGKGGFTVDVAYQAIFFADRTVETFSTSANDPVIPGEYENFTSILAVNLSWKFGK